MIRKFRITIADFIYIFLPPHKRQPVRQRFFEVMCYPFTSMMETFINWRDTAIIKANLRCETICLEWYLNELYDPAQRRIYIETGQPSGVALGRTDVPSEAAKTAILGFSDTTLEAGSADIHEVFYIPGENGILTNKSFAVMVPNDPTVTDKADAIRGVVRNYKLAGKTFIILTTTNTII